MGLARLLLWALSYHGCECEAEKKTPFQFSLAARSSLLSVFNLLLPLLPWLFMVRSGILVPSSVSPGKGPRVSMAASCSTIALHSLCLPSPRHSPKRCRNQTLVVNASYSQPLLLSFSCESLLGLQNQRSLLPGLHFKEPTSRNSRRSRVVLASQSNFFKVVQTVWKVGKDGIEAGTNMVPDSVPRPVARISVTAAVLAISLFVLNSFLSTAFFVLATMGLVYFTFIALNKDKKPRGAGESTSSLEDPVEEARRIMEKYK